MTVKIIKGAQAHYALHYDKSWCPNCMHDYAHVCKPTDDPYDSENVVREEQCFECGATWKTTYVVSGYKDLRVPPLPDSPTGLAGDSDPVDPDTFL